MVGEIPKNQFINNKIVINNDVLLNQFAVKFILKNKSKLFYNNRDFITIIYYCIG